MPIMMADMLRLADARLADAGFAGARCGHTSGGRGNSGRGRSLKAAVAAAVLAAGCAGAVLAPASPAFAQANLSDRNSRSVVTSAGSTVVFPVLSRWSYAFQEETHVPISYQPNGMVSARSQIDAGSVTFAITDVPWPAEQLASNGFVQWPLVFSAVVPVVSLPGVHTLALDAATLAEIYLGRITRWSDPALARLNPATTLPDLAITIVSHEREGGSSLVFNRYLAAASPDFARTAGITARSVVPAGAKTLTSTGDIGVALTVAATPGAIGYTDYADAVAVKATMPTLAGTAGPVQPTPASVRRTVDDLTVGFTGGLGFADLVIDPAKHDATANGGWPLVATSFVVMNAVPQNRDNAAAALRFFDWIYQHGAATASGLGYVPLPPTLVKAVEGLWTASVVADDKSLWPQK